MAFEQSYGIIPLRKQRGIWMVLLIQHSSSRYWGFPKGHAEEGEAPQIAASRELKEETNLDIKRFISEKALEEHYQFFFRGQHVNKTVWYFIAEVTGDLQLQSEEVSDSKWVFLSEAADHLTYDTDKTILNSAKGLLN